jgi:lia operon protein LiaG
MAERTKLLRIIIVTSVVSVASLGIAAAIAAASGGILGKQPSQAVPNGAGFNVDERRTLTAAGVESVSIETVSDGVRIVDGKSDTIEAWLHGTVRSSSSDVIPQLSAELRGSTADIRLEYPRTFMRGFHWNNLVLEVSVPRGYRGKLSAKSVSASIEAADHSYDALALSSTSGSIRVASVSAAEFSAHTTSGSLRAEAVNAENSAVSSVSGSIRIGSLKGNLKAHTTSGSIKVGCRKTPDRLEAESTSGSVVLSLPADASFTLDARSTSGTVSCKFPIAITENRRGGGSHVLSGKVGSGIGRVHVRTTSGSIRIGP